MTLKMTTAQVVETSVTVTNSSFQNYTHPDDHTTRTTDTPGFKPFTICTLSCINNKLPGPAFKNFRSYYQLKSLTIAGESYHEGAEPNQTTMPEKAACSFQNKPNLLNSRTRGQLAELEKLACESRMSEVNVSMRNQIYFKGLLSLNANLQIILYPQQIYRQQN